MVYVRRGAGSGLETEVKRDFVREKAGAGAGGGSRTLTALSEPGDFESPASAIPPLRRAGKSLLPVQPDVAVEVRDHATGDRAEDVPEHVVHIRRARRQEKLDRLDADAEQSAREEDVHVIPEGGTTGTVDELPEQERPDREHGEVAHDPDDRVEERVRQVSPVSGARDEALDILERREIRTPVPGPLHQERHDQKDARVRDEERPLQPLADANHVHGMPRHGAGACRIHQSETIRTALTGPPRPRGPPPSPCTRAFSSRSSSARPCATWRAAP